ncbi:MAG: hypothetical protein ACN6NZ_08005, partial [Burkholderiales bacterium]
MSGSLCGWGDVLIPSFTLAVFVQLDPEVRLQRLRVREFQRYGEQIFEGDERHAATQTFLTWAAATTRVVTEPAVCGAMKPGSKPWAVRLFAWIRPSFQCRTCAGNC